MEMLQLEEYGSGQIVRIGIRLVEGVQPQVVVRRGVWQGARLAYGGSGRCWDVR